MDIKLRCKSQMLPSWVGNYSVQLWLSYQCLVKLNEILVPTVVIVLSMIVLHYLIRSFIPKPHLFDLSCWHVEKESPKATWIFLFSIISPQHNLKTRPNRTQRSQVQKLYAKLTVRLGRLIIWHQTLTGCRVWGWLLLLSVKWGRFISFTLAHTYIHLSAQSSDSSEARPAAIDHNHAVLCITVHIMSSVMWCKANQSKRRRRAGFVDCWYTRSTTTLLAVDLLQTKATGWHATETRTQLPHELNQKWFILTSPLLPPPFTDKHPANACIRLTLDKLRS